MKSKYLILMCTLNSVVSHSQPYLPLTIENATWIQTYGVDDFTYFHHYAFKVQGDTTFEGRTYKKLYRWELADNTGAPYQIEGVSLAALIRDDTTTRRVYGVLLEEQVELIGCSFDPPQEALLYDFSIEIGDTLQDCTTDVIGAWVVIESVTTENIYGMERRVWPLGNSFTLIEGVGNSVSFFFLSNYVHHAAFGPVSMDYCIGDNFECGLHTSTAEIERESEILVFPNPVSDVLQLKSDRQYILSTILGYDGSRLGDVHISASQEINVSQLLPGIYTLIIEGDDGRRTFARFVKI